MTTPSAALARANDSSGSVEPSARRPPRPIGASSNARLGPKARSAAASTASVAAVISGPMPSPAITARRMAELERSDGTVISFLGLEFARGGSFSLSKRKARRGLIGRGGPSCPAQRYASAFFTRSGDIGKARRRLPVIWNSALAMAGATATTPISPMPVGAASLATIFVWISGRSLMRSTG